MVVRTGRSLALSLIEQQRHQEARDLLSELRGHALKLSADTDATEMNRLMVAVEENRR